MGEEAIQYARSYAFEAERKMGQLIKDGMDSGQVQKQGRPEKGNTRVPFPPIQLAELGLTRPSFRNAVNKSYNDYIGRMMLWVIKLF